MKNKGIWLLTALLHRQLPFLEYGAVKVTDGCSGILMSLEVNEGESAFHNNIAGNITVTVEVSQEIITPGLA